MNKIINTIILTKIIVIAFLQIGNGQPCLSGELYGWATKGAGTTGGKGGDVVEVSTMADLKTQASKSGKLIIFVKGQLSGSFSISSNKTIIGYPGAKVGGISINGASNIIVRNLIVRGSKCNSYEACKAGSDAVSLSGAKNIWLDHLDIADGQDGNLDCTDGTDFVTISWCKLSYTYEKQHAFSNLNGAADGETGDRGKLNITFHHNWWADGIQQRQPRMRFGKFHVANNLYSSQKADYAAGVGIEAKALFEGNIQKSSGKTIEYFPGGVEANVLTRNNMGPADVNATKGTAFTPDYQMPIDIADDKLEAILRSCAGATLSSPSVVNALEEMEGVDEIVAFPNPFKDKLELKANKNTKYELVNVQGEVVLDSSEGLQSFDTANLPVGLYVLRTYVDGNLRVYKLQKLD